MGTETNSISVNSNAVANQPAKPAVNNQGSSTNSQALGKQIKDLKASIASEEVNHLDDMIAQKQSTLKNVPVKCTDEQEKKGLEMLKAQREVAKQELETIQNSDYSNLDAKKAQEMIDQLQEQQIKEEKENLLEMIKEIETQKVEAEQKRIRDRLHVVNLMIEKGDPKEREKFLKEKEQLQEEQKIADKNSAALNEKLKGYDKKSNDELKDVIDQLLIDKREMQEDLIDTRLEKVDEWIEFSQKRIFELSNWYQGLSPEEQKEHKDDYSARLAQYNNILTQHQAEKPALQAQRAGLAS